MSVEAAAFLGGAFGGLVGALLASLHDKLELNDTTVGSIFGEAFCVSGVIGFFLAGSSLVVPTVTLGPLRCGEHSLVVWRAICCCGRVDR
jgi:hypothetical protein